MNDVGAGLLGPRSRPILFQWATVIISCDRKAEWTRSSEDSGPSTLLIRQSSIQDFIILEGKKNNSGNNKTGEPRGKKINFRTIVQKAIVI